MTPIPGSPRHVVGERARRLEALIGLRPYSLRGVERRANGDVAVKFRQQVVGDQYCSRRTLRIPAKRVEGYRQRSPQARPTDVRHRQRQNSRRFAWWLERRLGLDCPVVKQAVYDHDCDGIEELRALLWALLVPRFVLVQPEPVQVPDFVPEEWCA